MIRISVLCAFALASILEQPEGSASTRRSNEVIATAQFPTGVELVGLPAFVDNFKPGAGSMLPELARQGFEEAAGMELSGANLKAPIALIVVSPKKFPKPMAILVRAVDLGVLRARAKASGLTLVSGKGLALIGPPAVVREVRDLAFGSLAKPPSEMVVRLYPGALTHAYKADLQAALARMTNSMSSFGGTGLGSVVGAYEDLILAAGEQTEVAELRVGGDGAASELYVRLQPRAGTTMAALARAQVPAKHDLLSKLPDSPSATWLMSGRLHAASARKPALDLFAKVVGAMMPAISGAALTSQLEKWLDASDGRFAMSISMDLSNLSAPKMSASYLLGASDTGAMRASWRGMMKVMLPPDGRGTLDSMGAKLEVSFEEKALQIDGVEVDRYHSKPAASQPAGAPSPLAVGQLDQMYFAAFDGVGALALADDSLRAIRAAIASARGRAPGYRPTAAERAELGRSVRRGESAVMIVKLGGLLPAGTAPFSLLSFGFGQDRGALVLRISVSK